MLLSGKICISLTYAESRPVWVYGLKFACCQLVSKSAVEMRKSYIVIMHKYTLVMMAGHLIYFSIAT